MSNNVYSHDAYETLQTEKLPSFVSQTTPSSVKTECEIIAPAKYVVPIIFVPGIMGSNIKDNNKNKVWYPGAKTLIKYSRRDAKERQIALNPKETMVGYDGAVKVDKKKVPHMTKKIAEARGWGSVITIGYADVLMYLESQLNYPFLKVKDQQEGEFKGTEEWQKIVEPGTKKTEKILKNWSSTQTVELLNLDQHEELADYAFPVFACGYNWLQSNMQSADDVANRMNNEVMTQVKKEFPTASFKKFIIVTHSMGGLVTRALAQHVAVKDKIAGVVHGVMPASGAPAVYQRLTVGWDGWKASTGVGNGIKAWLTKGMFGKNSERLTATLASAPGGLELLPFANYSNAKEYPNSPKAWMLIKADTPTGEITATLPKTDDPYTEMYKRKDSWWAMMNPDFIDPAGLMEQEAKEKGYSDIFDVYRLNVNIVRDLHNHIQNFYHPTTFAHYGADEEYKSYGQVVWRCKEKLNISSEEELIELIEHYGKKSSITVGPLTQGGNDKFCAEEGSPLEAASASQFCLDETEDVTEKEDERYTTTNPVQKNAYKEDGVREVRFDEKFKISKNNKATFYLDIKPTSKGDGTVCYQSGQDVRANGRSPIETFEINGYEHSGSYDNADVQLNTIYCITKIVDIMKKGTTSC